MTVAEISPIAQQYIEALRSLPAFQGDVDDSFAARLSLATDNSIYQVLPAAIIYPTSQEDVVVVLQAANQPEFTSISLTCRGGGTGTDGQSLTSGFVLDFSRYMNHIVGLDLAKETVWVEPGVVLDQLNDVLKPHGYFFPALISPSNRATLGGMFATDACGQGSCQYGRTSDYVLQAQVVLSDGSLFCAHDVSRNELPGYEKLPGLLGRIYQDIPTQLMAHQQAIESKSPAGPRKLTGYNVAQAFHPTYGFKPQKLLAGSEGTLAITTLLQLSIVKRPEFQCLVVVAYASFQQALTSARAVLKHELTAIETVDDRVLSVARSESYYQKLAALMPSLQSKVGGLNLFEMQSDQLRHMELKYQALERTFSLGPEEQPGILGFYMTQDPEEIKQFWDLRKKSVGLLANLPGVNQPVPFVEDTAVPPEHLPEYIEAFRALLESYGLNYGMFGHVDAGCLHVRPALNMQDPEHQALIPLLTAEVCRLVKSFGGILCGEHGTGYRTRPAAQFFGEELMGLLGEIKTLFDPKNKLNPGKIVAPQGELYQEQLVHVEGPLKGEQDRHVDHTMRQLFQSAFKCNGNAACMDYHPDTVMCPSGKVMHSRVHTPKGRAAMLREWTKRVTQDPSLVKKKFWLFRLLSREKNKATDFSHDVHQVLAGCLGCKACRTNCPVKVDIPQMKSTFLSYYHGRYARGKREYILKHLERLMMLQTLMPKLARKIMSTAWVRKYTERLGLVDVPLVAPVSLSKLAAEHQVEYYSESVLKHQSRLDEVRTVFLIQDIFTSAYEPDLVMVIHDFLKGLGYQVFLLPFYRNGKPAHVQGDLKAFKRIAAQQNRALKAIGARGLPIVGIDPSTTLAYRDEYRHALGTGLVFQASLIQEWLWKEIKKQGSPVQGWLTRNMNKLSQNTAQYAIFLHCTEATMAPESAVLWERIFEVFGLKAQSLATGCCGMSGPYGHLVENQRYSREIYEMSWEPKMKEAVGQDMQTLVTGFSCRCQVARYQPKNVVLHPVEALYNCVTLGQQGYLNAHPVGGHEPSQQKEPVCLH